MRQSLKTGGCVPEKPNRPVRGFEWEQLSALSSLLERLGSHGFRQWPGSPEELRTELQTLRTDPEQDVFLAFCEDVLCGCALIVPETDIDRVVASIGLLEDCQHLAASLLGPVTKRAKSYGVSRVHVAVQNTPVEPLEALRQHGFRPVTATKELTLDRAASGDIQDAPFPDGFSVRPMRSSAETLLLTRIQNTIFKEHWGFSQNTPEEVQPKLDMEVTGPEHVLFVETDEGEVAAYIWTAVEWDGDHSSGRIWMTGVMPEFRGSGLGHAVVNAGIKHLLAEGVADIHLEVVEDNDPAVRIYTDMGFKPSGRTEWHELKL